MLGEPLIPGVRAMKHCPPVRCRAVVLAGLLTAIATVQAADRLAPEQAERAAANYQQYCVLCHGAERQGYANDQAPSLRSKSLLATGIPHHLYMAIAYGRAGTPMGAFLDEVGGPMSHDEINQLALWLREQVPGVEFVPVWPEPVTGDISLGASVFASHCAECHGENGEGKVGPAIGNPAMLANVTDLFLRYAIANGRDGTEMPAWQGVLSEAEIDSVTAFLRSRVGGWTQEKPVLRSPPAVQDWVLNPGAPPPEFELKDGRYIMAADLDRILREKRRMILIDTRVSSMWQMGNIEGSVPLPYYFQKYDELVQALPNDGTWIFLYCECPRAAARSVQDELRARGYANTAVLYEGVQGWAGLGYPVMVGETVQDRVSLPE
jgi:cytochrome c oxidase cbb3-type subunit 3